MHEQPILLSHAPLANIQADALIVPWAEGDGGPLLDALDAATGGVIRAAVSRGAFTGRAYDTLTVSVTDASWHVRTVVLVGAGPVATCGATVLRRVGSVAGTCARQQRYASAAIVVRPALATPAGDVDMAGLVQAVAEGLRLAEFTATTYQTTPSRLGPPAAWTVVIPPVDDSSPESVVRLQTALDHGRVLGEATNHARALVNEPGNHLTPQRLAERATALVADVGVQVEVLDRARIEALGMGLLLGVAQGSVEPPCLMVFRYDPPGAPPGTVLGLVGKGITFDTGGISIKPAENMDKMKDDMAGGAAVICAMRALAQLQAPVRVIGVVPATENMPGGRAVKPGDVLRSAQGTTVEVLNTDAEGRLVLGDALWYARQLGATHLVDVATLTGAIVVALGKSTTGLFSSHDAWAAQIQRAGERAGDRLWRLPLFDDYRDQIKSEIADLANTGGRPAGSITAALFLQAFAGGLPWAHLDIAGTAWTEEARPWMPKGPTGVAVRTLVELALAGVPRT